MNPPADISLIFRFTDRGGALVYDMCVKDRITLEDEKIGEMRIREEWTMATIRLIADEET